MFFCILSYIHSIFHSICHFTFHSAFHFVFHLGTIVRALLYSILHSFYAAFHSIYIPFNSWLQELFLTTSGFLFQLVLESSRAGRMGSTTKVELIEWRVTEFTSNLWTATRFGQERVGVVGSLWIGFPLSKVCSLECVWSLTGLKPSRPSIILEGSYE